LAVLLESTQWETILDIVDVMYEKVLVRGGGISPV